MSPPNANQITTELLLRIAREVPHAWCWRNNRVDTMAAGRGGKLRRVSAGIDGQGDVTGLIAPLGRRCEIEIKAGYAHGRDRQSPVQEAFQKRIESMGGLYILVEHIGWDANGRPDVSSVINQLKGLS